MKKLNAAQANAIEGGKVTILIDLSWFFE